MEIIRKQVSWRLRLITLSLNEKLPFGPECTSSVRALISGQIKEKYPNLEFSTELDSVLENEVPVKVLMVKRIK